MNTRRLLSLLLIALVAFIPSYLITGCESEDSPDTEDIDSYFEEHPYVSDPRSETTPRVVSISPSDVEVTFAGQQVSFTAIGGQDPYVWDTANHGNGTIDTMPNTASAVYTAHVVGPNDVIVYDQHGRAAIATINGPSETLLAVADPSQLDNDGDLSVLTASGGVPPYHWEVGQIALGNVSPHDGSSVIYTRAHNPDNSVTVTDSAGNSFNLVIKQP